MKKFERYFTLIVILAGAIASLSCAIGAGGADQKATEPPLPLVSTALPRVASTDPVAATRAPAQLSNSPVPTVPSPGSLTTSGGTIDNYSMALVFHAEGKDDQGKLYKQEFTFAEDSIKSQKAGHFKISGMSALPGLGSGDLDIYQLENSLYMFSPAQNGQNASCLSLGGDATTFDPSSMNPAAMMKDITVDRLLESGVMVNGVKADHYTLKNVDLGFAKATPLHGASSQSGEVWLAQDGGYAVKFTGQAQGAFDVVSSFTGTMTWSYDVTNVNKLTSIALPDECSSQQTSQFGLIFPPNATGLSQLGQMTVFSSPDKPADVSAYFQKNLPDKGWTIDSVNESMGPVITLQISKASQKMQIMITSDTSNGGSSAVITPAN